MVTRAGLRAISTYAQAIGPSRERVLRSAAGQDLPGPAPLVHEAHRAELAVFCWTLRAENAFLPEHLRRGTSPHALGNAIADAMTLLTLGVDGLITDSPDHAVRAVKALWCRSPDEGARRSREARSRPARRPDERGPKGPREGPATAQLSRGRLLAAVRLGVPHGISTDQIVDDHVLVAAGADADHADPGAGELLEPPHVGLRVRRAARRTSGRCRMSSNQPGISS